MAMLYPESSVVVLADQQLTREIKPAVEHRGLNFIQVQSLELGAFRIQKVHTELIVLDQDYPEFNEKGLILLYELNARVKNIPIILISNSNTQAKRFQGDEFSNIEYVKNPGSGDLAGIIDKYLQPSIVLKFWGVRGSTPSANLENMKYGGNTTCVQIESPEMDEILILDSGTGIRNLGNEIYSRRNNEINGHIFITHPHWDHIQGFPFFKPFYLKKNKFNIYMPEQYRGGTQEILSGHMTKTFFPVTIDMFAADLEYHTQQEEIVEFSGFTIEYMVANHPTKTAMYKIQIGGYVIIFAPDNELNDDPTPLRFMDQFEHFIRGCDLLIHDGQFSRETYKNCNGWGHSAWEETMEVARRCNVRRLVITHHDPDSTDTMLDKVNVKLQDYQGNPFEFIALAKEGMVIKLPLKKAVTAS